MTVDAPGALIGLPQQLDLTTARSGATGKATNQRRLTGSIWTEERQSFTSPQREGNPPQRCQAAVRFPQITNLQGLVLLS